MNCKNPTAEGQVRLTRQCPGMRVCLDQDKADQLNDSRASDQKCLSWEGRRGSAQGKEKWLRHKMNNETAGNIS